MNNEGLYLVIVVLMVALALMVILFLLLRNDSRQAIDDVRQQYLFEKSRRVSLEKRIISVEVQINNNQREIGNILRKITMYDDAPVKGKHVRIERNPGTEE